MQRTIVIFQCLYRDMLGNLSTKGQSGERSELKIFVVFFCEFSNTYYHI